MAADVADTRRDTRGPAARDGVNLPAGQHAVPAVSVIVPLYNSSATIERAIRSALAQTCRDIEVIVADDASTDHGPDLVAAMAQADSRVRLLRLPENRGKPHAMNCMTETARGDWLAVLDADDAFEPNRLEVLLRGAREAGVDMAADNIAYIDSGVAGGPGNFGAFIRHGFDPGAGSRILEKSDLLRDASSFAAFDYGILKPVISRAFVAAHALRYDETSRLAEDFTYLLTYMVAGGRVFLSPDAMYQWTMPFGARSRRWTQTGAGPWRYDYRQAIVANDRLIETMALQGEHDVVAMLRRRGRQYRVMVHYIDAQRLAASGNWPQAAWHLLRHPETYTLLARRVAGRLVRRWH